MPIFLLNLVGSRLSKYLFLGVAVGLAAFAIYTYVSYTNGRIETLSREKAILEIQVDQYKKAIEELKANYEKSRKILDDLFQDMIDAGIPEDNVMKFFLENDLSSLAPEELERIVNEQAVDIQRCFEVQSGDTKKPGETNRVCPNLFR